MLRVLSRLSRIQFFTTPWTVARQAPLSMGFSRQEDWSGFPCPPPGDLPNPGMELRSPTLQEDSLPTELPGKLNYSVVLITAAQQSDYSANIPGEAGTAILSFLKKLLRDPPGSPVVKTPSFHCKGHGFNP